MIRVLMVALLMTYTCAYGEVLNINYFNINKNHEKFKTLDNTSLKTINSINTLFGEAKPIIYKQGFDFPLKFNIYIDKISNVAILNIYFIDNRSVVVVSNNNLNKDESIKKEIKNFIINLETNLNDYNGINIGFINPEQYLPRTIVDIDLSKEYFISAFINYVKIKNFISYNPRCELQEVTINEITNIKNVLKNDSKTSFRSF